MATNDAAFERRVEDLIEQRVEAGAFYSSALSRLRHMTAREVEQRVLGNAIEQATEYELRHGCTCYPKGFVSQSREVKERLKAEHIARGEHSLGCPLYCGRRDYEPWSFGLTAPSYTAASARREQDAMNEATE